MTDDNSPENLRKFLESDDPAMVRMGLSMAKGSGVPDELLGLVAGLYMWDDDNSVRAAAKSTFMKHAPDDVEKVVLETWKTSYRTLKDTLQPKVETMLISFKDTLLDTLDVWKPALVRTSGNKVSIVRIMDGFGAEAVKPLIKALGDDDWGVHKAAAEALVNIGEPVVEPLIKALEDDNIEVRKAAVETLGEIGDGRAVEPLIEALSDNSLNLSLHHPDEQVRWSAAGALGEIGDVRAVDPLIKALSDNDKQVRWQAAGALDKLGWIPETDEEKLDVLVAKSDWISITALGNKAVDKLISLLDDESYGIAENAANCLGDIGDKRAVESLIKILQNQNRQDVHEKAILALGKIRDKRAFEVLVQVIDEAPNDYSGRNAINLAMNALVPLNDGRTIDVLVGNLIEFSRENTQGANESLTHVLRVLGDIADVRAVKPIIEWLDGGVAKITSEDKSPYNRGLEERILKSAGNALGKIGKSALKEILTLLESDRYGRIVSVIALDVIECKPDNDELMALYLLTKEDWDLKSTSDPETSYIQDCIDLGEKVVDILCKVIGEFKLDEDAVFNNQRQGWRFYLMVAEVLARIGDKRAVEPLKKAGLENHVLWISGDVEGLIEIISSDEKSRHSVLLREIAAKALGYVGDEKAIDPLMDVLSRDSSSNRNWIGLRGGQEPKKAIEKIRERAAELVDSDDESNINLLLESDNHSKVVEGLALAKEMDLSEEQMEIVLGLRLWNGNSEVRKVATEILKSNGSGLLKKTKHLKNTYKLKTMTKIGGICDKLTVAGIRNAMPVKTVIARLEDRSSKEKVKALVLLGKIGNSQAVIPLITAFTIGNHQCRTAMTLGKIGDSRAVKPLIEAFHGRYDSSEGFTVAGYVRKLQKFENHLRVCVAKALGMIGGSEIVKPLIEAGLIHPEANVRGYSAEALGKIGDSSAVGPLVKIIGDSAHVGTLEPVKLTYSCTAYHEPHTNCWGYSDGNSVGTKAMEALGKIGDGGAVDPLIKALSDNDKRVRWQAAGALREIAEANIKGKEKENLIRFLESDDPAMVLMGTSLLKGAMVEPLTKALGDENKYIRDAAKEALKKLGHEVEHTLDETQALGGTPFLYEIQHPDYEATDLIEINRSDFIDMVLNHNWNEEFYKYEKMQEGEIKSCPPSIYLRYPINVGSPMLHLYKIEKGDDGFNFFVMGFPSSLGGEKISYDVDKTFEGRHTLKNFINLVHLFFDNKFEDILNYS